MEQGFIDILKKLTTEQGKEALLNPSKCKAFLADYVKGEYKKESRLLLQSLEIGAAKAIDAAADLALCKQQQIRALQDECFLVPEVAADLVDTLALVLRGDTSAASLPGKAQTGAPQTPQAVPAGTKGDAAFAEGYKYYNSPIEMGENGKAVKSFTEAINLGCSDMWGAYYFRGMEYYYFRQYDQAISDFTMAINHNPNNPEAYAWRGEAYFWKRMMNEAIRDVEQALRLNPNNQIAKLTLQKVRGY